MESQVTLARTLALLGALTLAMSGCNNDKKGTDGPCVGLACQNETDEPHTGDTGDTHTGDTGDTHTGDTGDTHTGDTGDTHTGDTGDTHTGDTGDTHTGDTGDTDTSSNIGKTAADLAVGDIAITELHIDPKDCLTSNGQYIEFVSVVNFPFDIQGLQVYVGTKGFSVQVNHIVQPGDHVVLLPNGTPACDYLDPTFVPDQATYPSSTVISAAGSQVSLRNVQHANYPGLDGVTFTTWKLGGTTPTVKGRALQFNPISGNTANYGSDNDFEANWCMSDTPMGTGDYGTPGQASDGACYQLPTDTGTTCLSATELLAGELIITEIMPAIAGCSPDALQGAYVEVYNASGSCVDLTDLRVSWGTSPATTNQPIAKRSASTATFNVQAGQYFLLQRGPETSACPTFSGVTYNNKPVYYFDFPLSLGGATFALKSGTASTKVIDSVDFSGWPLTAGGSWGFDGALGPSATLNDSIDNWCAQPQGITGVSVSAQGTPFSANLECIEPDTDEPPDDTGSPPNPGCRASNPVGPSGILNATNLCPSDLIIHEIMLTPGACSPYRGCNYIEVYNASPYTVDLDGVQLSINGSDTTIEIQDTTATPRPMLASGDQRAVWFKTTSASYKYAMLDTYPTWWATNASVNLESGVIRLVGALGVIDKIDTSSWSIPYAASYQVRPEIPLNSASDNDNESAWCVAVDPIPARTGGGFTSDKGTPDAENHCASEPGDTDDTSVPFRDPSDGLDAEELLAGELVITEAMFNPTDCSGGASARYIELYNPTPYPIRPAGLKLTVNTTTATLAALHVSDTIPSGGYEVVGFTTDAPFCYGATRRFAAFPVDLRPATVRLANKRVGTIDAVNFSAWQIPTGISLQLNPSGPLTAEANNLPGAWCPSAISAPGGLRDRGTPGSHNTACGPFSIDEGVDTGSVVDKTSRDLVEGDLIVSEVMIRSECPVTQGQYIEIYNTTAGTVDIGGVQLLVNSASPFTIPGHYTLGPAKSAVLVRGHPDRCFVKDGFAAAYPASTSLSVTAANTIKLQSKDALNNTRTLDTVSVSGASVGSNGQAMQLSLSKHSASANDQQSAWCANVRLSPYLLEEAGSPYADFGTPGHANYECGVLPTDSWRETDTGFPDTNIFGGSGGPRETDVDIEFVGIEVLQPGDIVITEVMLQPSDCSPEATAEYIEVYNRRNDRVNLRYLEINDKDGVAVVRTRALIEPHSYAVLLNEDLGVGSRCYGLEGGGYTGGITFNNNGEPITLRTPTDVIDSVDLTGFPRAVGRSWELYTPSGEPSSTANDASSNWCLATGAIPGGRSDRGTPGEANTCVPGQLGGGADPNALDYTELQPGDLVITEMMLATGARACTDANTQYLEIQNATAQLVNLRGMQITNRFDAASAVTLLDDVYIEPGGLALGIRAASPRCYALTSSFQYAGPLFAATGDHVQLLAAGALLVDGVDTRAWTPAPEGAALQLDGLLTSSAGSNDLAQSWCTSTQPIAGGLGDQGTPKVRNPSCPAPGSDTDADTGALDTDTSPPDSYPTETGNVGPGIPLSSVPVGDLLVSELLVDPVDCADQRAEFIELRNRGLDTIDLFGLQLATSTGSWSLAEHVYVAPGNHALGVLGTAATQCHHLPADFYYTGVTLDNQGGTLTVRDPNQRLLSTVAYGDLGQVVPGRAWSLDPDASTDANSTDWCLAYARIPGATSDYGTPGFANPPCHVPSDTDIIDTYDTFFPDSGPTATPLAQARVGDLIITEFMLDPQECSDQAGEYIEIYNNSATRFDLNGLIIGNGTTTFRFERPPNRTTLMPGEYLVARSISTAGCYGFNASIRYQSVPLGAPANVVFIANTTTVLDLVHYNTFDGQGGRAWTLDPDLVGARAPLGTSADSPEASNFTGTYLNDSPADWCQAYERLPGALADKGSPGEPNLACLQDSDPLPYPPGYVANIEEVEAGDLVITEIMFDPKDCNDLFAEYIEIYNNFPVAVDLRGLQLTTLSGDSVINTPTVLEPGHYAVGRKVDSSANCYPSLPIDFLFFGVNFANGGDNITIANRHTVIDRVDSRDWASYPGKSLQLRSATPSASANDNLSAWCWAGESEVFTGAHVDRGSPGTASSDCEELPEIIKVPALQPGDIVVSEFLTTATDCPAGSDQYLELASTIDKGVDLRGLYVWINGTPRKVLDYALLPAHGFVQVAINKPRCIPLAEQSLVFLSIDISPYFLQSSGNDFRLFREAPISENPDGQVLIDELRTASAWPNRPGQAYQLKPNSLDATANDDPVNWCVADKRILPSFTRGTPGLVNDCDAETDTDLYDTDTDVLIDTSDTSVVYDVRSMMRLTSVIPGVMASGNFGRYESFHRGPWNHLNGANYIDVPCYYEWSVSQTVALPTAGACPSCEFAFALQVRGRVDYVQMLLQTPSDCSNIDWFVAPASPATFPSPLKLYFSSSYGMLMIDQGGVLTPYMWDNISYMPGGGGSPASLEIERQYALEPAAP